MRTSNPRAAQLALVVLLVLLGYYWWTHAGPPGGLVHDHGYESSGSSSNTDSSTGSSSGSAGESTDPVSGLPWIQVDELPDEAVHTLALIHSDGPFPYDRDGVEFGNFEGILPDRERGYYHEYTVPTPGESSRGARRIVVGDGGEYYWTDDHYQSFQRIENP